MPPLFPLVEGTTTTALPGAGDAVVCCPRPDAHRTIPDRARVEEIGLAAEYFLCVPPNDGYACRGILESVR